MDAGNADDHTDFQPHSHRELEGKESCEDFSRALSYLSGESRERDAQLRI